MAADEREGSAAGSHPWVDVTTGQCYQQQDDGTWIPCACDEGQACGFDGGAQHAAEARGERDGMEYQRAMLAVCETAARYFQASLATPQSEMEQLEIDILNAIAHWEDERGR